MKQRLFFNNLLKYNKDKLLLFPSELGGFINPTVSSQNISQSEFTFRHVGEGFVPDRQQRHQVEEERHEGSHQQTAPAERTTHLTLR